MHYIALIFFIQGYFKSILLSLSQGGYRYKGVFELLILSLLTEFDLMVYNMGMFI